jgi:hypothetical protein
MSNPFERIRRLFFQKLVADEPRHPWLKTPEAQEALHNWTWKDPRRVDVWWWMDVEITDGADMVRYGRVSWNQDGTGYYDVSISYEREGVGLHCWPDFRALSDAQEFVERLMCMSLEEAQAIHGQQWPGVVL